MVPPQITQIVLQYRGMKNFILAVLILIAVGEAITLYVMNQPSDQKKVLAEATSIASITPAPTETSTPIPLPTATPTPKPTKKPTPKPSPISTATPIPPEVVSAFVDRFAAQYSVDVNVMRHVALCESGFNPNAINGPYVGLYQFGAVTWKNLRAEMGEDTNIDLRLSAEEAAQTAAYAISLNKRGIWPNCNP